MLDNSKEYILCSAIRRKVPRKLECYWKNDIKDIEIGYRHCDIMQRFGREVLETSPDAQGFYTSKGRFVSREEGMEIAKECGQIESAINNAILTSEDLY